jgi:hypothetical protein
MYFCGLARPTSVQSRQMGLISQSAARRGIPCQHAFRVWLERTRLMEESVSLYAILEPYPAPHRSSYVGTSRRNLHHSVLVVCVLAFRPREKLSTYRYFDRPPPPLTTATLTLRHSAATPNATHLFLSCSSLILTRCTIVVCRSCLHTLSAAPPA